MWIKLVFQRNWVRPRLMIMIIISSSDWGKTLLIFHGIIIRVSYKNKEHSHNDWRGVGGGGGGVGWVVEGGGGVGWVVEGGGGVGWVVEGGGCGSGCDFKHAIFNFILLTIIFRSTYDNSLRWMLWDYTDDNSAWVQVMAMCRQATGPYMSQYWPRSMSQCDVTWPQWVSVDAWYNVISGLYEYNVKTTSSISSRILQNIDSASFLKYGWF